MFPKDLKVLISGIPSEKTQTSLSRYLVSKDVLWVHFNIIIKFLESFWKTQVPIQKLRTQVSILLYQNFIGFYFKSTKFFFKNMYAYELLLRLELLPCIWQNWTIMSNRINICYKCSKVEIIPQKFLEIILTM